MSWFWALKVSPLSNAAEKHLTNEDLHKIVTIKSFMNWGLSKKSIEAFSNIISVERPLVKNKKVKESH